MNSRHPFKRLIRLYLVIITSKLAMSLASFAVADLVTYEWHMTLIMQADLVAYDIDNASRHQH